MILRTRHAGDVAVRGGPIGDSSIPLNGAAYAPFSGALLNRDRVVGLAAYGAAIRLIATTIASFELCVYEGTASGKREMDDHPAALLLEDPAPGLCDSFDWLHDLARCVEVDGNWFALKRRSKGKLVALDPIPPDAVRVRRSPDGFKVFDVMDGTGWRTMSTRDILHVRGFTHTGFVSGFSAMRLWANDLGNALALSEFQGAFFRNGAAPGLVIEVPGRVNHAEAKQMLDLWSQDHQGLPNAHRPAVLWNGASVTQIPVNMSDAQFIESQKFSVEQIARITGVPAAMLDAGNVTTGRANTEQDALRFLTFCILPRAKRILAALAGDRDLFPDRNVYPQFEYDEMLAVDAQTQASVDKEMVQSGIFLVDEVRARKGLPPLPPVPDDWTQAPGMVPQITPVGGAPNPTAETGRTAPAEVSDDAGEATISGDRSASRSEQLTRDIGEAVIRAFADPPPAPVVNIQPAAVTVNVPEQPAPVVNIAPTQVDVHLPEQPAPIVRMEPAAVTVNVPEQAAPVVNVAAADVTVNVPDQPAAQVTVNVPEQQPRQIKVARDSTGRVSGATVE